MGIKDSKDIIYYPNGEKKEFIWDYEVNKNFSSSFRPDMVETMDFGREYVTYKISIHGKSLQQCFDECYEKNTKVNLGDVDLPPMFDEMTRFENIGYTINMMGFPVEYKPVIEEVKIYGGLYPIYDDEGHVVGKIKKMLNSPVVFHPLKNKVLKIDGDAFNETNYYIRGVSYGDHSYISFMVNDNASLYFEITKMKFCAVPQYYAIYDKKCFSYFYDEDEELVEKYFTLYCELMKDIVKYKEWKLVIDAELMEYISESEEEDEDVKLVFTRDIDFAQSLFNRNDIDIGKQAEIGWWYQKWMSDDVGKSYAFETDSPYEELNRIMVHPTPKTDEDGNRRLYGGSRTTSYEHILSIDNSEAVGEDTVYNYSTVKVIVSYDFYNIKVKVVRLNDVE